MSAPSLVAGAGTVAAEPVVVEPGRLRIARQYSPDRMHPQLNRGYGAFQRGDDAAAKRAYRRVLQQQPNNRDALLGLAALAYRQGEWEAAASLYIRLLNLDPRDSVAQAALLSMQQNLDPVASESRIKLLLEREPDAPYLHFSLGNFYSMQSRWAEAQQAYFNAYRVDADNADYAFNLAVSLDHLAQADAALKYYRRAMELASGQSVGFQAAMVQERIANMANSVPSE